MSIQYKFLGRPKTLEEFIDKARWAVTPVDILVQGTGEQGIFLSKFGRTGFDYYCSVKVLARAGKIKLKLADFWEGNFLLGRVEAEKKALEMAVETAEKLLTRGFRIRINNKSLPEVKSLLRIYDEICQKYSRARGKISS